jgi:hypothetical protein
MSLATPFSGIFWRHSRDPFRGPPCVRLLVPFFLFFYESQEEYKRRNCPFHWDRLILSFQQSRFPISPLTFKCRRFSLLWLARCDKYFFSFLYLCVEWWSSGKSVETPLRKRGKAGILFELINSNLPSICIRLPNCLVPSSFVNKRTNA